MTQSIIVYRNPAEAALWESGLVFPLIVACVLFVICVVISQKISEFLLKRFTSLGWRSVNQYSTYISITTSAIITGLVIYRMVV